MHTKITLDKDSHVPIHYQIRDQIAEMIQAGQLKAGDRLPTMRALAEKLGVNFNTVAHAYRELDREGLVRIQRGQGSFVRQAPAPKELARLRERKLAELVETLFETAERLGYMPDDIQRATSEHLARRER